MKVHIQINDKFNEYLQNVDINSYINDLIAQDMYRNSSQFEQDKIKFQKKLNSALKGNTLSHNDMWNKIDIIKYRPF
jgi:hypothetical protein